MSTQGGRLRRWAALLVAVGGLVLGPTLRPAVAQQPSDTPGRELAPGTSIGCTVGRVIDGDTLECENGRDVRLLLIDTPEMGQGAVGELAREALLALAPPGTRVTLEIDVDPVDRYGRTLAYVVLPDGRMANEELLERGVAVVAVYPPNIRHVDRFREVMDEARTAGRGLWALDRFECLPSAYRAGRCGRD